MRGYFADDAWETARSFYEDWPKDEWIDLFRDFAAAIPEGAESEAAEDLLRRWNALGRTLWQDLASNPHMSRSLHDGFARAWRDRENWPDTLKRRFADYRMNEVAAFLARVSIAVLSRRGPSWFAQAREGSPPVA